MSSRNRKISNKKRKKICKLYKDRIFEGITYRTCCFCNKLLTRNTATLEHVIPLSKGGTWKTTNIKVSCSSCNNERGNGDFEEFRKKKTPVIFIPDSLEHTVIKQPNYIHLPS